MFGVPSWDDVTDAAGSAWDSTLGHAVSFTQDLCFESWQEAATCAAVVAGTVSLGAGVLAAPALLAGTSAGTAGVVSTGATWVGFGFSAAVTVDACRNGLDASCVANGIGTALSVVGAGGFAASTRLGSQSLITGPLLGYSLTASGGSTAASFTSLFLSSDERSC